jgi:hypothetical protein
MNQAVQQPAPPTILMDLSGDRAVEWSWVNAMIPSGPGTALDFGPGKSQLGTVAAMKEFDVTGVDMTEIARPFLLPNLHFIKGELLTLDLPDGYFDLVINCSSVEHSGLSGRYGVEDDDPDGDLKVMCKLRRLMKRNGVHLLTIPVGRDIVWRPLHRIYGEERLPQLISGFRVRSSRFWIKDHYNRWVLTSQERALRQSTLPALYGLGCFELQRDDATEVEA